MKALFLTPVLLLAACASTGKEAPVRTVEVKVPVRVACVPSDLAPKPAGYADDGLTRATPPDERYRATAQANEERKARLARVEPVIASCR